MSTSKAITCYGTDDDRKRAAALAKINNVSQSELLINYIRSEYTRVFGDLPPGALQCGKSSS